MNKKTVAVGVLFLFLIGGSGAIAQQILYMNNSFDEGRFTAELGVGRGENPDMVLQGSFRMRGRVRIISGSYEIINSERSGQFGGQVYGNHFFIVFSHGEGKQVIYGRMRADENQDSFYGFWRGRGTERLGWISGSFI